MLMILLSLSLLAFPTLSMSAIDDEPAVTRSDISSWIENLGDENWSIREEAARKLLDAGPAAVDALRSSLQHPDPEVRARIKEMLSLLSPPILIVDVVRIGNASEGSILSRRTHLDSASIRFTRNDLIQSSVTSATEERRIQVEIRGTEAPYSVEILFPGVNTTIISGPPARGLDPGVPWVILSEERVAMEHALGETTTVGELATWAAVIHHNPSEELERMEPAERLRRAILKHLPRTEDPALWMLASIWPEPQILPAPAKGANARVLDAHSMALLSNGETTARQHLTDLIADHLDGTDSISIDRIDALIPGLIEADIDRSIELMIRHCGDLSPWRQHLTWHALLQRIEDPEFASTHGQSVIEAILSPAALPILRWTNSRMASIWSALHRHVPSDQWMEALDGRVRNALGEDLAQAPGRIPLILGTLAFLSNQSEQLPLEWLTSVSQLIPTQHSEIAVGVLAAQMQQLKDVPEEIWKQVCKGFAKGLVSTDTTIGFRVRNSVTRLSQYNFLPQAIRRILEEDLIRLLLNYGEKAVEVEMGDEKGTYAFADVVMFHIKKLGLTLEQPNCREILGIYDVALELGKLPQENQFLQHTDSDVQECVANALIVRHVVSENWAIMHQIYLVPESDLLEKAMLDSLHRLQLYTCQRQMKAVLSDMKKAEPDGEEMTALQRKKMELDKENQSLCKYFGTVVLPFLDD